MAEAVGNHSSARLLSSNLSTNKKKKGKKEMFLLTAHLAVWPHLVQNLNLQWCLRGIEWFQILAGALSHA
jgi:hypothetical protein